MVAYTLDSSQARCLAETVKLDWGLLLRLSTILCTYRYRKYLLQSI